MSEVVFRYRAFISYRHVERDRNWARWLVETLETYRTPRALVRHGAPARIGKLFRDDDEVPASADLTHQVEDALRASQFLIVVCSRDTPQSAWVGQEIDFFRAIGRGDRILVLLVDGEPSEAFPPNLLQQRNESDLPAEAIHRLAIEPIAADVRPQPGERRGITQRRALLRIAAGLLGVGFDDLARRDQQRARHRTAIVAATAVASIAILLLGGWYVEDVGNRFRESAYIAAIDKADGANDVDMEVRLALESSETPALFRPSEALDARLRRALYRLDHWAVLRATEGSINNASPSPDGRFVLVVGSDGDALMVDDQTSHDVWRVKTGNFTAALSRDGKFVVLTHLSRLTKIDSRTGRELLIYHDGEKQFAIPNESLISVEISADGRRTMIATEIGDTTQACVFDNATGALLARVPIARQELTAGMQVSRQEVISRRDTIGVLTGAIVRLSPNGEFFVASSKYGPLALYATASGARVNTGTADQVLAATFSADSRLLAVASATGSIGIWQLGNSVPLPARTFHAGNVLQLSFNANATMLLVASWTGPDLSVIDLVKGAVAFKSFGNASVQDARFAAASNEILVDDGRCVSFVHLIFNFIENSASQYCPPGGIKWSSLYADDFSVLVLENNGMLSKWDPLTHFSEGYPVEVGAVGLVDATADAGILAAASPAGVQIYFRKPAKPADTISLRFQDALFLSLALPGHIVLAGNMQLGVIALSNRRVENVVNVKDTQDVGFLDIDSVHALHADSDGISVTTLAGHRVVKYRGHGRDQVTAAHFACGAATVVSVSVDGAIDFWDAASGRDLDARPPIVNDDRTYDIAVDSGCKTLVAGGADGFLRVYDLGTRTLVDKIKDGRMGGSIVQVGLSRDGRLATAMLGGGGIEIWDIGERVHLATIPSSPVSGHGMKFLEARKLLVVPQRANEIAMWDLSVLFMSHDELRARACDRLGYLGSTKLTSSDMRMLKAEGIGQATPLEAICQGLHRS